MSEDKIVDIVSRAAAGEYDVPEFQRQFVWSRERVPALCDSLFRGFPIGSLLLWDARDYRQPQIGDVGGRRPFWIVDGQQRISTLCILFGRKPHWWNHDQWSEIYQKNRIYINVPLAPDDRVTFGRPQRGDPWVSIPVDEILQNSDSSGAIEVARTTTSSRRGNGFDKVVGPILKLWNLREELTPTSTLGSEMTLEEAAEVFRRLNEKGTRVKQTDIRLAYIAAYNPGWVRTHLYEFLEEMQEDGWDIDSGHILQALAAFKKGKARVGEVGDEFWRTEVTAAWWEVKEAIEEVLLRLWDKGVVELDLVPSDYTLIPLFVIQAKFGKAKGYSFDEMFRWFILANLAGRYSGQPLETLNKDAETIFSGTTLEGVLSAILPDYSTSELQDSLNVVFRRGSAQAFLLHVLLWQRNARDWFEELSIPALTKAPKKLEPHWHHILPKGWAKKSAYEGADQVANVTLICARTNIKGIGSKPPWDYAKERIPIASLTDHFIPERFASAFHAGDAITGEDFKRFIEERRGLLANEAAQYLRI